TDINAERLAQTEAEMQKKYGKDVFLGVTLDVTDTESLKKAIQKICLKFGGLDIIVNNAGISISKPLEEHTEEDWNKLLDILVKG
ncbi:SDR family NAD(P)-dependent oxidoreductase, partial [Algoriphagus lutimaris]|nr:SDR family NAD(P)-dependent oxidoreductase [Algoriphagus lutimaris]